ncbi:DUF2129 domain-containing protein [Leuconostoc mesenteroides]|nr:DUF2129 domain-containing protein [Leuconostoc mesenteroides]
MCQYGYAQTQNTLNIIFTLLFFFQNVYNIHIYYTSKQIKYVYLYIYITDTKTVMQRLKKLH